jgi:hypothetical protein
MLNALKRLFTSETSLHEEQKALFALLVSKAK